MPTPIQIDAYRRAKIALTARSAEAGSARTAFITAIDQERAARLVFEAARDALSTAVDTENP